MSHKLFILGFLAIVAASVVVLCLTGHEEVVLSLFHWLGDAVTTTGGFLVLLVIVGGLCL